MLLNLIVAMAHHRVIGLNGQMPWHLPADLAWFKKNTSGNPVIMGRKTFESIGRPLPNRHNIVISQTVNNQPEQNNNTKLTWVSSLSDAIAVAQQEAVTDAFIIGGGHIYQQALSLVDQLYLTHIDADLAGDTYFPDYHPEKWQVIYQEAHQADEKNPYDYRFEILKKA
ncbi:type 3 dihydrofolate reductase [Orbaceae bacterium ESL0727]|nr:type 3 dihydrofolate reductase [Orbaceae bacterium ESL0727]